MLRCIRSLDSTTYALPLRDHCMNNKKIVVTGATGFVGLQMIPLLVQMGATLLLVGRTPAKLAELFPGHSYCEYADIPHFASGFDQVIHLAAQNNNALADYDQFVAANVSLVARVIQLAKEAKIPQFINISTIHALDEKNQGFYAKSKRQGFDLIKMEPGIVITTLYLPLLYSSVWGGKLEILNRLPKGLANFVFKPLAAMKPTLHIRKLATELYDCKFTEREVIITDGQRHNIVYQALSRSIDLVFAFSIVLFFWWMLIIIAMIIRHRSDGPALFRQQRVGQNGQIFTCLKFRTMAVGTAHVATHEVSKQSISPLGGFLRKYKLDELPQIWNIFLNQIKLIGPRPCLPTQLELIQERNLKHVLDLKPGISGLAQVHRIDMSNPEILAQWDSRYLSLQCLVLDVQIIIATVIGRGNGDRTQGPSTEECVMP